MFFNLFRKNKTKDDANQTTNEATNEAIQNEVDPYSFNSSFDNSYTYSSDLYKKNSRFRDTGFSGTLLLNEQPFDFDELSRDLSNMWFIDMNEHTNNDGAYVFNVNNFIVTICLENKPIPTNEIQTAAAKNYMWLEGITESSEHKAHITVSIIGEGSPFDKGIVFVKIMDSCCNQENVIGVYANGAVYKTDAYKEFADILEIEDSPLPILNLVWIGFTRSEHGMNAYTNGLQAFYKDEIEIVDSPENLSTLHSVMVDLVNYVLENDVDLIDGETIGFNPTQNWEITRSKGVVAEGMTLKIDYK